MAFKSIFSFQKLLPVQVEEAQKTISSLEKSDAREYTIAVAGPGALLVAKLHKISDRINQPGRQNDKDALDILRLLQTFSAKELADRFQLLLGDEMSAAVTKSALEHLRFLFQKATAQAHKWPPVRPPLLKTREPLPLLVLHS
ncbi:MAG TPA: hypothetical protein VI895_13100 [Bdellovibrionota bacterium]|nr:hypothetical protein [Bdellovibrionota bacterium]